MYNAENCVLKISFLARLILKKTLAAHSRIKSSTGTMYFGHLYISLDSLFKLVKSVLGSWKLVNSMSGFSRNPVPAEYST
jgi:hypothetical protein